MRKTLLAIVAVAVAIVGWGLYGKLVLWGQADMSAGLGQFGWLRPLVWVGLAYFLVGVAVSVAWFYVPGDGGDWSVSGTLWSVAAGVAGSLGTAGVLLAFAHRGAPIYVIPVVCGGAAVINALATMYFARRTNEVRALFLAGTIVVVLGAVAVFFFAPVTDSPRSTGAYDWMWWPVGLALAVVGWGVFGPLFHNGRVAMSGSQFRPLLCVGLASLVIAVFLPSVWLSAGTIEGQYTFRGALWSMLGGAAGAIGVVGVIAAYSYGLRSVYVLPAVFGGVPIVNTLALMSWSDWRSDAGPLFLAGLILIIGGSAMVLVLAKHGEDHMPVA
jgi:hypothetical protein